MEVLSVDSNIKRSTPRHKVRDVHKVKTYKPPPRAKNKDEAEIHKLSLEKLKDSDPSFYKFLKENDEELLNFDLSSSSDTDEEAVHQLPDKLEVASDDSEVETEETKPRYKGKAIQITPAMVKEWSVKLQSQNPSLADIAEAIKAFRAAVAYASDQTDITENNYYVEGSIVFNSVMRLCIVDMPMALNQLLEVPQQDGPMAEPTLKLKPWSKLQLSFKSYIFDLNKILSAVSQPTIISALLKHVIKISVFVTSFQNLSKVMLKRLINFWCTGEESVRVLAFLGIVRITHKLQKELLEFVLKTMYLSYVKNCKFTSPSSWPLINFMKRSLAEIFALNEDMAYRYGFVYIRQLAIHLRNAITLKQKDSIKSVYNWQYIHCLSFLGHLLCHTHPSAVLKPLIYPLVQITMGVIRLVPTAKYYPLRLNCIRILISLSKETQTFIPVLHLLTEVLEMTDFNAKVARMSWKPIDFNCTLKLSKSQLSEQSFKDGILDHLYELFVEYLNTESHSIGFPELLLPTILQMKAFLKKCKVRNYSKQIRQLLEKIEENSNMIYERRRKVNFRLNDSLAVKAWENQCKLHGTPISRYYKVYRKMRDHEVEVQINKKDQPHGEAVPVINRRELVAKQKERDKAEFGELFPSDDEGSEDDFIAPRKKKIDDDEDGDAELTDLSDMSED